MKPNNIQSELNLSEFLPYRINILAKRISHSLSDTYTKDFGITIDEWRVLAWISTTPLLAAKDICERTYMDKTKVCRILAALEKRDLVQRETDENDQRSYRLALTEAGLALTEKLLPKAINWEDAFIDSLNDAEYRCILNSIEKLENQLDEWQKKE